jgi:preprotein translocase subunit SecA
MDDDLMRLFGGARIKNLMSRIGMEAGEPIYHPWLSKNIEKAQKKVEERNFEIRKHLLEYDDVLNQQRKFIYEQRDAILRDNALKVRVNDATADMINGAMAEYERTQRRSSGEAERELAVWLKEKFGYKLNSPPGRNAEEIRGQITSDLEADINEKEALAGTANLNACIRIQYLQAIDRKWLDHLENMEALREAVYLRSYGQKNPLTEYKIEGFQIFDTMIDMIRQEIASRIHLMRIQAAEDRDVRNRSIATVQSANHGTMSAFAGAKSPPQAGPAAGSSRQAGPAAQSRPEAATIIRAHPKVGRNDPCPCGSGKKYKFCHGR